MAINETKTGGSDQGELADLIDRRRGVILDAARQQAHALSTEVGIKPAILQPDRIAIWNTAEVRMNDGPSGRLLAPYGDFVDKLGLAIRRNPPDSQYYPLALQPYRLVSLNDHTLGITGFMQKDACHLDPANRGNRRHNGGLQRKIIERLIIHGGNSIRRHVDVPGKRMAVRQDEAVGLRTNQEPSEGNRQLQVMGDQTICTSEIETCLGT